MTIERKFNTPNGDGAIAIHLTNEELQAAYHQYLMLQDKEMVMNYLSGLDEDNLVDLGIHNDESLEYAAVEIAAIMRIKADESRDNFLAEALEEALDNYKFAF